SRRSDRSASTWSSSRIDDCSRRHGFRPDWPLTPRGTDERFTEAFQAARAGGAVRFDQDRTRLAGDDPRLVVWRGEEAGDHQLPDVQAGARRTLMRQDLRPGEGLRVPLRQVQAPQT